MQLDHLDVLRANTCLLMELARRVARHVDTNHLTHVVRLKSRRLVGGHDLRLDAHRAVQPK